MPTFAESYDIRDAVRMPPRGDIPLILQNFSIKNVPRFSAPMPAGSRDADRCDGYVSAGCLRQAQPSPDSLRRLKQSAIGPCHEPESPARPWQNSRVRRHAA